MKNLSTRNEQKIFTENFNSRFSITKADQLFTTVSPIATIIFGFIQHMKEKEEDVQKLWAVIILIHFFMVFVRRVYIMI